MPSSANAGVVIYAKNLDVLAAFYEQVLHVAPRHVSPAYVVLDCRALRLVIHAIPAHIAETFSIAHPPLRREDAAIKLSLPVHSLQVARTRAAELGGALDPVGREWELDGRRLCDGHDPEGNVLQLHEAIHGT